MTIANTISEKDLIDEVREIYIHFKKNKIKVYAQKKFKKEFLAYIKDEEIIKKAIDFKKNAINQKEQLLYIYQIATIIDACYSTQVRRFIVAISFNKEYEPFEIDKTKQFAVVGQVISAMKKI